MADNEQNPSTTFTSIPQPPITEDISEGNRDSYLFTTRSHPRRLARVGMSVSSYGGLIAGIVIGVLVFVAAVIGTIVYIRRHRRRMLLLHAKEIDLENKAPDEDVDDMASVHAFLSQGQREEEGISSYKTRDDFNQEHMLHAATRPEKAFSHRRTTCILRTLYTAHRYPALHNLRKTHTRSIILMLDRFMKRREKNTTGTRCVMFHRHTWKDWIVMLSTSLGCFIELHPTPLHQCKSSNIRLFLIYAMSHSNSIIYTMPSINLSTTSSLGSANLRWMRGR